MYPALTLLVKRDFHLLKLGLQVFHVFYLVIQVPVLLQKDLLLATFLVNFDIHLPDVFSEPCHQLIVLLTLGTQALIGSIQIADLVVQLSHTMLLFPKLVS